MSDNQTTVLLRISSEIWRGSIPIELTISEIDLSTSTAPSPCFLFLPRMSYLGVVAADAVDYLKSYAIDIASDVWFESLGVPLKWFVFNIFKSISARYASCNHADLLIYDLYFLFCASLFSNMPIGVLFDLHCSQKSSEPWRITVHFRDFPVETLLKCCSREAAEKMYMHTLKQALFVLQGNTRSFNAMIPEQQQLIWEGANSGSRAQFEGVAADLRGGEAVKCVPVRILLRQRKKIIPREHDSGKVFAPKNPFNRVDSSVAKEAILTNNESNITCIQKPVHTHVSERDNQVTLLSDVLFKRMAGLFTTSPTGVLLLPDSVSVCVQGIKVPFNTPILQLWTTCSHADFFLYIIVIVDIT